MEERRRFKRYPIYCPIEYRCEDNSPVVSSITLNLSEGGALISTGRPLEPGARLVMKIVMKEEEFFIRARVMHIHREEENETYDVGIEFLQSPFDFIRRFYEELEAIMLYQRQCLKAVGKTISLTEASMKWFSLSVNMAQ